MLKNIFNKLAKNNNSNKEFLSCHALNGRLVFFNQKIAYCSNGNPTKGMQCPILIKDFYGKLNINQLANIIREDRLNLYNGNLLDCCIGCHNLKNQCWEIDFSKYPKLDYIQFSDYFLCNSKCIYCGAWTGTFFENGEYKSSAGNSGTYAILPIIKKLINKKMITKDTVIDFAGGEPTIYFQFEKALNYLIKKGIKKILVFSNVIKYSKAIQMGIKKGVITLIVSVDAGFKETHHKVKGVESFDKVYENLRLYSSIKKTPENLITKFVIVDNINDSEEEINEWIRKSLEIGITTFILNADNRIFENPAKKETMLKIKKLTEFFVSKMKQNNLQYELYSNINYVIENI